MDASELSTILQQLRALPLSGAEMEAVDRLEIAFQEASFWRSWRSLDSLDRCREIWLNQTGEVAPW